MLCHMTRARGCPCERSALPVCLLVRVCRSIPWPGPPVGNASVGVIKTTNPDDTTLPPKLQSHLAHLQRYASPATKALPLSHESLAYYLTGVLNASMGFQALHLTQPTTALQPATRAVTKAWAAQGGWPSSIPTLAIRAFRGRHRGRGKGSLHQAHHTPPSPHDPQPLPRSPRSRHDQPPGRTKSPQHMPTLDTQLNRHAHQHQHPHLKQPAALTPFPTPRHTHEPSMPGGRAPGSPL